MTKKEKKDIKNTIKFLKGFMNVNRKQQLDIISKFERKLKNENLCSEFD